MGAYLNGNRWWISFRVNGRRVKEGGGFDGRGALSKTEAEEKLRQRLGELVTHSYIGREAERITVSELLDSYLSHLETRGYKSPRTMRGAVKAPREFFAGVRAVDLSTQRVRDFIAHEQARGLRPASVNRFLQALKAALRLAQREGRLRNVIHIPLLREDNRRTGFVTPEMFRAIHSKLSGAFADAALFGWLSGWRLSEILHLEWSNIERGISIVLADSKNGERRSLPIVPDSELDRLIEKRWARRSCKRPDGSSALSPWVFCTPTGGYLWKFDRTWRAATIAAGLRGVFFHDLRRSAIRDMIRGGVSVPVAMSLSGHKTLSVFNRYNITTAEDQIAAVRALSAYRALASATPGERGEAPVAVLKRS